MQGPTVGVCLACLKNSMEASAGQSERVRVAVKEVQGRRVGQISCWALQGTVRICFFSEKNGKSRKGLSRGGTQPNFCFTMIILDAMSGTD